MQDTKIITYDVPNCIYCDTLGVRYQSNVLDPDGIIQTPWSYNQCNNNECKLVWLDPAPLETELWKAYTNYHTHTKLKENLASKAFLSVINRIVRITMLPLWLINGIYKEARQIRLMMLGQQACGKLLDIGCGGGRFLNRMQRRGWVVEGIDFDAQATRRVGEKYGIKTYTGDLLSAKMPDASFDAITMGHSIEHLVNPKATLCECLRILKPGGTLVITTPNVESRAAKEFGPFWRGWEPPRHLHLFNTETIKLFLVSAGFKVGEILTLAATSGTYRASAINQRKSEGQAVTLSFKIKLIFWSYYQELKDLYAQKEGIATGQNLLVVATKPLQ